MVSTEKITANRNNAKKSTGPRTKAGKLRTSRNALRHGLAAILPQQPLVSAEIERMAKLICPDSNSPAFEQALIIAECEVVLRQARAARVALIERAIHRPGGSRALLPGFPTEDAWRREVIDDLVHGRFGIAAKRLKQAGDSVRTHTKRLALHRNDAEKTVQAQADAPQPALDEKGTGAKEATSGSNATTETAIEALRRAIPELLRLERYVQRAFSRRKRAIRQFIAISLVDAAMRTSEATQNRPSLHSR
jgi:hypothetical protein